MASMDTSAAERLRRLQMEDLGTARREYISTNDRKRFLDTGLDELDATRVANQAGSEAHRAAELNKSRLASWANMHKELDDTQDLERLDNLLDGQSHRAQLSMLIRESGGQAYTKVMNKKDNFLKVAETDHRGGPSFGRGSSGGRGGGVIGTRGRQTCPTSYRGSSRTSNQGSVRKLSRHVVETPLSGSRLDPSLDCNNNPSKNRDDKIKFRGKAYDKQSARTNLRTRRPIVGDYARILSPPESFLAIARSSLAPAKPSNDASAAAPQSPNVPQGPMMIKAEQPQMEPRKFDQESPVSHEKVVRGEKPVASPRLQSGIEPISTPKTSSYELKVPKSSVSAVPAQSAEPPAQNDNNKDSGVINFKHPKSPAERDEGDATVNSRATGNIPNARQPASSDCISSAPKAESKPVSAEPEGDLLLDFGTTPPEPSPLREKQLKSPAFEDLKGIDFKHSTESTSSAGTAHERSRSKKTPNELKKAGFYKGVTSSSSNRTSSSDYEREIFFLSAFLESTTLGDEYCEKLKKIRAEIEEKLRENQQVSTTHTESQLQEAASEPQKTPVSSAQSDINAEPNTIAAKSKATPEIQIQIEGTLTKHAKKPSDSSLDNSDSAHRLRQAVNAAPFYPRSGSFSGYRSPINSISSDSTSPPPTPIPPRSKAIPIGRPSPVPTEPQQSTEHIFGDHLLPGRHSRTASSLRSFSSASHTSTNDPSTQRVSFSVPARGSVLKNVNILDFGNNRDIEPVTQTEAPKDIIVIKKSDSSCVDVPSPVWSSKEETQSTPQTASNAEKVEAKRDSLQQSIHAAKPSIQASTSNNTPMVQKTGPAICPSLTPRPGANPVSPKSPLTMTPKKELLATPKADSIQQTIHTAEPARRTDFFGNDSVSRNVESPIRVNPLHAESSVPTKSPPVNMVKDLPGPKPKLASIKQSIYAVAGAPPSKHQPSMSMPKRVDQNVNPSNRSIYAAPPETQHGKSSSRLSGIMASRYAMPEDSEPSC